MNARQFEAFNRLSSYVVHDLKNVAAQLALVVTNAERHRSNPAFVDDAFNTVSNATQKMNRMLAQLRKGGREDSRKAIVDLATVLQEAVSLRSVMQPVPVLTAEPGGLLLLIDQDKLVNVLAHLIHNAQEASQPGGRVEVQARQQQEYAEIDIIDDGCGMDEQFIRERLFRPFDTTKGNAGMGIGAYESREFVWSQGGDMVVESQQGRGTRFRIRLPLYRDAAAPEGRGVHAGEGH
jgi:putative PEP-CTERM system histidine kinase